ncbi:unnamed protein product, partial [Symbiodinium pilosum]
WIREALEDQVLPSTWPWNLAHLASQPKDDVADDIGQWQGVARHLTRPEPEQLTWFQDEEDEACALGSALLEEIGCSPERHQTQVPQLRAELRAAGLDDSGVRSALVERLTAALTDASAPAQQDPLALGPGPYALAVAQDGIYYQHPDNQNHHPHHNQHHNDHPPFPPPTSPPPSTTIHNHYTTVNHHHHNYYTRRVVMK